MFTHAHPSPAATLPRPAYPDASRIVVDADRRTRELAEAMLRLNAEDPDGCTETTLDREGFSIHEQRSLGPTARRLANGSFVKKLEDESFARYTDEQLLEIALDRVDGLFDPGQIIVVLRGDLRFTLDSIARIWPRLMTKLGARIAVTPIPGMA